MHLIVAALGISRSLSKASSPNPVPVAMVDTCSRSFWSLLAISSAISFSNSTFFYVSEATTSPLKSISMSLLPILYLLPGSLFSTPRLVFLDCTLFVIVVFLLCCFTSVAAASCFLWAFLMLHSMNSAIISVFFSWTPSAGPTGFGTSWSIVLLFFVGASVP